MKKIVNPTEGEARIKDRKKRVAETTLRGPYKKLERTLNIHIVGMLRMHGCSAGLIKTTGTAHRGKYYKDQFLFKSFPDIVCFNHKKRKWYYLEGKVKPNKLSKRKKEHLEHEYSQEEVRDWCVNSNVEHIVAYSWEDCERIVL